VDLKKLHNRIHSRDRSKPFVLILSKKKERALKFQRSVHGRIQYVPRLAQNLLLTDNERTRRMYYFTNFK